MSIKSFFLYHPDLISSSVKSDTCRMVLNWTRPWKRTLRDLFSSEPCSDIVQTLMAKTIVRLCRRFVLSPQLTWNVGMRAAPQVSRNVTSISLLLFLFAVCSLQFAVVVTITGTQTKQTCSLKSWAQVTIQKKNNLVVRATLWCAYGTASGCCCRG